MNPAEIQVRRNTNDKQSTNKNYGYKVMAMKVCIIVTNRRYCM
jgi:hypothetical protein